MTTRSIYPDVTIADTTGMKRLITGTNLVKNPRGVNTNGVSGAAGTGGAVNRTLVSTGGPLAGAPSFIRQTFTTAPTGGTPTIFLNGVGVTDVDANMAGRQVAFVAYARASKASSGVFPTIGWFFGDTYGNAANGAGVPVAANTWTLLTPQLLVLPSGTTRLQLQVNFPVGNFTSALQANDTIDATAFVLYLPDTGYDGTYLDGDMTGASWLGTPHASRSTKIVGIA